MALVARASCTARGLNRNPPSQSWHGSGHDTAPNRIVTLHRTPSPANRKHDLALWPSAGIQGTRVVVPVANSGEVAGSIGHDACWRGG
jgi:hypothetical protein